MIDYAIAKAISAFGAGTFLDKISEFVSLRLLLVVFIALIALIVLWKDKKYGKYVVIALIIAVSLHLLVGEGLWKSILADNVWIRERPYLAYPGEIMPIGRMNTDSSFPSDHMSFLAAGLFVICYYYRKKGIWILSIAGVLIMALSRIHNGMHYPSDVLFGTLIGMVYGFAAVRIANWITR